MIAPTKRIPVAHGYARVSTISQVDSGLSLEAQQKQLKAYFELLRVRLDPNPLAWGDVFVDPGISGYKIPFARREAGGALNARLQQGDHLIISRLDRAFRRVADAATMTASWVQRGITVHYLDFQIDTSNAFGRFALNIMAGMAEFESAVKSERMLAVNAVRRAKGMVITNAPVGMMKKGKMLVADPYIQEIMGWIVYARDTLGMAPGTIATKLNDACLWTAKGNGWSIKTVNTAYENAKKQNVPVIKTIPTPKHKRGKE